MFSINEYLLNILQSTCYIQALETVKKKRYWIKKLKESLKEKERNKWTVEDGHFYLYNKDFRKNKIFFFFPWKAEVNQAKFRWKGVLV